MTVICREDKIFVVNYGTEIEFDPNLIAELVKLKRNTIDIDHDIVPILDNSSFSIEDLNKIQKNANEWITKLHSITSQSEYSTISQLKEQTQTTHQQLLQFKNQINSPQFIKIFDILKENKRFYNYQLLESLLDTNLHSVGILQNVLINLDKGPIENMEYFVQKTKNSQFPMNISIFIISELGREFDILVVKRVNEAYIGDFNLITNVEEDIQRFNDFYLQFVQNCREQARKQQQRFQPIKITFKYKEREQAIKYMKDFRQKHSDFGIDDSRLQKAYEQVAVVDISDTKDWEQKISRYNSIVSEIEQDLIAEIKSMLSQCKSTSEMFSIFESKQQILQRPAIRASIQEYQNKLIEKVEEDIGKLFSKFNSKKYALPLARDYSSFSGQIVWIKSIENRVHTLVSRLQVILGPDYNLQSLKLIEQSNCLLKLLDHSSLVNQFVSNYSQGIQGPVFGLVGTDQLSVSINADHIGFKDVGVMSDLGVQFRLQLQSLARDEARIYRTLNMLKSTCTMYNNTTSALQGDLASLVSGQWQKVRSNLKSIWGTDWSQVLTMSYSSTPIMVDFCTNVLQFQELVNFVSNKISTLENCLKNLKSAMYCKEEFQKILTCIHGELLALQGRDTSNISVFIMKFTNRIEEILQERLKIAVEEWTGPELTIEVQVHDVLNFSPNLDDVKYSLFFSLGQVIDVVALPLPKIPDGNTGFIVVDEYFSLTAPIELLRSKISSIHLVCERAASMFSNWQSVQDILSYDASEIKQRLGDDVRKWQEELRTISKRPMPKENLVKLNGGSSTIENSVVSLLIDCKNAIQYLNHRRMGYEDILREQCAKLAENANRAQLTLLRSLRSELEDLSVDAHDIKITLKAIERFWALEGKVTKLMDDPIIEGELEDAVKCELDALREILASRKFKVTNIVSSVRKELQVLLLKCKENFEVLALLWDKERPKGNEDPKDAISRMSSFQKRVEALDEDLNTLKFGRAVCNDDYIIPDLAIIKIDIEQLTEVWDSLSPFKAELESLKHAAFEPTVNAQKQLVDLIERLEKFPTKVKQYALWKLIRNELDHCSAAMTLVTPLLSSALRDRHWARILRILELCQPIQNISFGDLWRSYSADVVGPIGEILNQAEGELALETFLNSITSWWHSYPMEFGKYKQVAKLVVNANQAGNKALQDLESIASMKNSVHYGAFAKKAVEMESWLQDIVDIMISLAEAQKQWIYLHVVFVDNEGIKAVLPLETIRFKEVTKDILQLLSRCHKFTFAEEVTQIPNAKNTLKRIIGTFAGVKKSLGTYLDQEREKFNRFYYLGDDDLLVLLGGGVDRVSPFLKKIYTSISDFVCEQNKIQGVVSREGEYFLFDKEVEIKGQVYEWLGTLEHEVKVTLFNAIKTSVKNPFYSYSGINREISDLENWINKTCGQVLICTIRILWVMEIEKAFKDKCSLDNILHSIVLVLESLAKILVADLDPLLRCKCEGAVSELVHQRDTVKMLIAGEVKSTEDYGWQRVMRLYLRENSLEINVAGSSFDYGFEYLGVQDLLVRTPLTDHCFLTLSMALDNNLGGSPFGPAGTGKTESVKSLASFMGRHCIVFCCDEGFDFQSMGRIFIGLCTTGSWGCFDEFNRLNESMMSAVSQQIYSIQTAVRSRNTVELVGRTYKVHPFVGIFITMNPGYAGRSELPDNLKSLFRGVAMTSPDWLLISQVLLFSHGFTEAEILSSKVIPFFELCRDQLSNQSHYDFGLRALKNVLSAAGKLQRVNLQNNEELIAEESIVKESILETVFPKLIEEDVRIASSLLNEVFCSASDYKHYAKGLKEALIKVCEDRFLYPSNSWIEKCIQLHNLLDINHGVMLVGPAGSGKTSVWINLFRALEIMDGKKGKFYVIDPKSVSKDMLYGFLDVTTREWTDGIFTGILRRIIDSQEVIRHWIIFDGDVDPEWVENLNSVLDDNRILTLPNGERLPLLSNIRVLFEVDSLRHATPATVSRCGMVWFHEDLVSYELLCSKYINMLHEIPVDEMPKTQEIYKGSFIFSPICKTQLYFHSLLSAFILSGEFLHCLQFCRDMNHIMDCSLVQVMENWFALNNASFREIIENQSNMDEISPKESDLEGQIKLVVIQNLLWSCSSGLTAIERSNLGEFFRSVFALVLPGNSKDLFSFFPSVSEERLVSWDEVVPVIRLDNVALERQDIVIPTVDTLRNEKMIYTWISERRSIILCGPPGSGKTMTLLSSLRQLSGTDLVSINFSSETKVDSIIQILRLHGNFVRSATGEVYSPMDPCRWLVVFCDEINLPIPDKYGTQGVISFLRQIIERGGFWKSDNIWVTVRNVQFVAACNPPTDPGRYPLQERFTRHCPVMFVDYPSEPSLISIYGTFLEAALKPHPSIYPYFEAVNSASVCFYQKCQGNFTAHQQLHYIFSPRELTRWVRGIREILTPFEFVSLEDLVRIWAHEGLRLFQDRLVDNEEKLIVNQYLEDITKRFFPTVDVTTTLAQPILFSNLNSNTYSSVGSSELFNFIQSRLFTYFQEESSNELILFNSSIDHILRIDRVLRQTQGHILLIGTPGCGKKSLTKFACWLNGVGVLDPGLHNQYSIADFDEDLKKLLITCGLRGEKRCLLLEGSKIHDPSFLERINTLLANSEIPGLFDAEEYSSLMSSCKDVAIREGAKMERASEVYDWFTNRVAKNMHVVFTMSPPTEGITVHAAASPALFNRCVLNWVGDWDADALFSVAKARTDRLQLDSLHYISPKNIIPSNDKLEAPFKLQDCIADLMLFIHDSVKHICSKVLQLGSWEFTVTPTQFLEFTSKFSSVFENKKRELAERHQHLLIGLKHLEETFVEVENLKVGLGIKQKTLELKSALANEKLKIMVNEQQEAETQRNQSVNIQTELKLKNKQIADRKSMAVTELAEAEPAVLEAKQSVKGIKKQHLTELRSLGKPPGAVKLTMEAVCILLGHKVESWKEVQSILRKDDFINSIVNYNTTMLTVDVRDEIEQKYVSDSNFTFEAANRASKACGPLLQWVLAQVAYSSILEKVKPLRREVEELEIEGDRMLHKVSEINATILDLERRIGILKEEYAVLISEVQTLKNEMEAVKEKVERSIQVLDNLKSEKERWSLAKDQFSTKMDTLAGDVLLSTAFISYCGIFEVKERNELLSIWTKRCSTMNLRFTRGLSVSTYLCEPHERNIWKENNLPSDDICLENATIISNCERYLLIVDPSGQAFDFMHSLYKSKNVMLTSFKDAGFVKTLETAVRFGNTLFIQDAEFIDSIIFPVLGNEITKIGGRKLCRIGSKEIDFASSFKVFLFSSSTPTFSQEVCSYLNIVNFTITPSSLISQCLHRILRSERPDIDSKKKDLMKVHGDYQLRLHILEKELLEALNNSGGNILEDEVVLNKLETLKTEGVEIQKKFAAADEVLEELEEVSFEFNPLAEKIASVFFFMERLSNVDYLYQFSLEFFMDILEFVLFQQKEKRKNILSLEDLFFAEIFSRLKITLKQQDLIAFALLLAQIRIGGSSLNDEAEWDFFYATGFETKSGGLSEDEIMKRLQGLGKLESFQPVLSIIVKNISHWSDILLSNEPERLVRTSILPEFSNISSFQRLIIIQALRPDRLYSAIESFLSATLGDWYNIEQTECKIAGSLNQCKPNLFIPNLLISEKGYDVSHRLETLASARGSRIISIALGSKESVTAANNAISRGSREGGWILIRNAHLNLGWLQSIEKTIKTIKNPDLKLFITLESCTGIAQSLLLYSMVIVFEQPYGLKYNLTETLNSIPSDLITIGPIEKHRIFFQMAWLHTVVLERIRYTPIGWSKNYDFSDADFEIAVTVINKLFASAAGNRSNINPAEIPWDSIRSAVSENVYGGKIDKQIDLSLIKALVAEFFDISIFESGYQIGPDNSFYLDRATDVNDFKNIVQRSSIEFSPELLGLQTGADALLTEKRGLIRLFDNVRKVTQGVKNDAGTTKETWKFRLLELLKSFNNKIQRSFPSWEKSQTPLDRFVANEFTVFQKTHSKLLKDIDDCINCLCRDSTHSVSQHEILQILRQDSVPNSWLSGKKREMNLGEFVKEFPKALEQLIEISKLDNLENGNFRVRLFNDPKSFMTATKRFISGKTGIPLQDLSPIISDKPLAVGHSFQISEVSISGAELINGDFISNADSYMAKAYLAWIDSRIDGNVLIPVYAHQSREEVLFYHTTKIKDSNKFIKRSVAIFI